MKKDLQLNSLKKQMENDKSLSFYDTNLVFGEGNINSDFLFIGEAPGAKEDELKRPFVGRSGKLLDKCLMDIGLNRQDVYITNIVKKRPPNNRDPKKEEVLLYRPYLEKQIDIIKPKIIVSLGRFALNFFDSSLKISKAQGNFLNYKDYLLLPMFHPAAALRASKVMQKFKEAFSKLNTKKPAFTLLEIAVAVIIIGIIFTIVSASFNQARRNQRDTQRITDIRQIQFALELYYNDMGTYPDTLEVGAPLINPNTSKVYLAAIPQSPQYNSSNCEDSEYGYIKDDESNSYYLSFCLEKDKDSLVSGQNCISSNNDIIENCSFFVCGDTFTDDRDGNEYGTVQIGDQCWMAENLKYTDICYSEIWSSSDIALCSCYSNNLSNCNIYGALYQWSATQLDICPVDWRVVSDDDFKDLERFIGMNETDVNALNWRGSPLADLLLPGASVGFDLLYSGYRSSSGSYSSLNAHNNTWLVNSYDSTRAWRRAFDASLSAIHRSYYTKSYGFSVRCVRVD